MENNPKTRLVCVLVFTKMGLLWAPAQRDARSLMTEERVKLTSSPALEPSANNPSRLSLTSVASPRYRVKYRFRECQHNKGQRLFRCSDKSINRCGEGFNARKAQPRNLIAQYSMCKCFGKDTVNCATQGPRSCRWNETSGYVLPLMFCGMSNR